MLTERQQQIVNNWDSEHEGNKKQVRKKFEEALEILPLLCELPPHEAREIVNDSINSVGKDDDWSQEKETPPGRPNSERLFYAEYFVECVIAILFNGVIEHLFQNGLEKGLKRGERWWMGQELPGHEPIAKFIYSISSPVSEFDSEPEISNKIREPPVTPENEREKLVWIFRLNNVSDEFDDAQIEFLLKCNIFDFNSEEIQKDKNKSRKEAIFERQAPGFTDDIANYETMLKAREAIESSQKTAEKVATVVNNSRNQLPFSFTNTALSRGEERFVKRVKRFYIELHREHLDENNLLPDDDRLPEASNLIIGAPNSSRLDLEDI
jgi:ribosome-binding protein aMBF1 (putative translation factor)